jgi:NAD(P)-dependent dehydrogenase (short-subunit alcohol dehydrogenase family)
MVGERRIMAKSPSVLIAGFSTGVGATYADHFARRRLDLILASRIKRDWTPIIEEEKFTAPRSDDRLVCRVWENVES